MGHIKTYRATLATCEVTLVLVSPINDQELPARQTLMSVVPHLFQTVAETVGVGLNICSFKVWPFPLSFFKLVSSHHSSIVWPKLWESFFMFKTDNYQKAFAGIECNKFKQHKNNAMKHTSDKMDGQIVNVYLSLSETAMGDDKHGISVGKKVC